MSYKNGLSAAARKQKILEAATDQIIKNTGFHSFSIRLLAKSMQISRRLIYVHFPTKESLQIEVLKNAIETENIPIIAYGLCIRHPKMHTIPQTLKRAAVDYLTGDF